MTLSSTSGTMSTAQSDALFARAKQVIPGGVNSPVRAFSAVGGTPRFMVRGEGPFVWDADGNRYVDFVMSWGPLIHGHAFRPVVEAVRRAALDGTSFGAPTKGESELAELIRDAFPSVDLVRFVSSGTEATMSAIRLARGYTGRNLVVKFAGNYHGHADALLVQAGSGALTLGVPSSPGVPSGAVADTIVLPYNDAARVEQTFADHDNEIAAVIVEPIAGNMGVVTPRPGFLSTIRRECDLHGAVFICDEVITGFRVDRGGAQAKTGIQADVTTFGKILGGGLPIGAYGGRRDIMECVAPTGPVYQAGTLSGNPISTAAGIASLRALQGGGVHRQLDVSTRMLAEGLRAAAEGTDPDVSINAETGMLTMFFTAHPVENLNDALRSDTDRYARFFHAMLNQGFYLPPSQFESWMMSTAHSDDLIEAAAHAVEEALAVI